LTQPFGCRPKASRDGLMPVIDRYHGGVRKPAQNCSRGYRVRIELHHFPLVVLGMGSLLIQVAPEILVNE
jgi:hypothetical protein